MKKLLITIAFLSIFQIAQGQNRNIDEINTNEGVENLIISFDKEYEDFELKRPIGKISKRNNKNNFCKRVSDSLNITKSYYKSDFDKNGYTDILAIGDYSDFNIIIIMNFGNDSIKLNRLTRRSFQNCVFPKIVNDSIIDYYYKTEPDWTTKEKPRLVKKSLIYKFGDFIEFNTNPKKYNIKKIEYQTTMCYGTCPKFSIKINKDKTAIFNAEYYNQKKRNSKIIHGNFKGRIENDSYTELVNLLNYIDFPNLKNNYSVNWTDDQTSTLKITYGNGKIKEIKDYGLIGTYGLDRLYHLLFEFRFNQNWRK